MIVRVKWSKTKLKKATRLIHFRHDDIRCRPQFAKWGNYEMGENERTMPTSWPSGLFLVTSFFSDVAASKKAQKCIFYFIQFSDWNKVCISLWTSLMCKGSCWITMTFDNITQPSGYRNSWCDRSSLTLSQLWNPKEFSLIKRYEASWEQFSQSMPLWYCNLGLLIKAHLFSGFREFHRKDLCDEH